MWLNVVPTKEKKEKVTLGVTLANIRSTMKTIEPHEAFC